MRNLTSLLLLCAIPTLSYSACGGTIAGSTGSGGSGGAGGQGGGAGGAVGHGGAGGSGGHVDAGGSGGHGGTKASGGSTGHGGSGGTSGSVGGGPVDAGYYYGDGSFWVEGGAYPGLGAPDASTGKDATVPGDASSGCAALAACCPSLSASSQSVCDLIASTGTATDCSTELTMLQADGSCTGITVLASGVQVPPYLMVSDGTLLFWTTRSNPGLQAMPVRGGAITTLVAGPLRGPGTRFVGDMFLGVDDANIYTLIGSNLVRMPKNGDPPTAVNESGAFVITATTLRTTAYWIEASSKSPGGALVDDYVAVKSAPLLGTSVSAITKFHDSAGSPQELAVTSKTAITEDGLDVLDFPLSTGAPGGHAHVLGAFFCGHMTSDIDAVYCPQASGPNLRIASDGTMTPLGPAIDSTYLAFDDTYVYWADNTTVGAIVKAPKVGGGTATTIAHDTSPVAIAVDANSVYWADVGGYIKSIAR